MLFGEEEEEEDEIMHKVIGSLNSPLWACSDFHRLLLLLLSSFVETVNALSVLECLSDVSVIESKCSLVLHSLLLVWRVLCCCWSIVDTTADNDDDDDDGGSIIRF